MPKSDASITGLESTHQLMIKIVESNGHTFNIEDTASGYFETLSLFSEIVSMEDSVLVIDEPALHLHPIKESDCFPKS